MRATRTGGGKEGRANNSSVQLHGSRIGQPDWAYRSYNWQDDAACSGIDPDKFMVSRRGDPDLKNAHGQTIRKHNLKKMEEAEKVCDGCPVRATCLTNAEESDLYWTMRGGQWPTSMRAVGSKYKKKPPSVPTVEDQDECPQGHVAWKRRSDRPGRYCATCSAEAGKRFRQRQKDERSGSLVG